MNKSLVFLTSIALLLVVSMNFSACQQKKPIPMKEIKHDDYSTLWKEVSDFEAKNRPKSAYAKVKEIYVLAKSESNYSQIVKAVAFSAKYIMNLEEEGLLEAVRFMEDELEEASSPVKPVLQMYLAKVYANYFQQNSWKFSNRTATDVATGDFTTWSSNQILDTANQLVLAATQDFSTRSYKSQDFTAILSPEKSNLEARPTLYDILAQEAINHFTHSTHTLTEPVYKFYLNDPAVFESQEEFLQYKPNVKDSTSAIYRSILLLQDLTRFHQSQNNTAALLDLYRQRLNFAKTNGIFSDKEELYEKGLQKAISTFKQQKGLAYLYVDLMNFYYHDNARSQDTQLPKDNLIKAHQQAEEIIRLFPDSQAAKMAQNMLAEINLKSLSIEVEAVYPKDQALLTMASVKNVEQLRYRIYLMNDKLAQRLKNKSNKERIGVFAKEKPIRTSSLAVPSTSDYQNHSFEFPIEGLQYGNYVLIAWTGEKENIDKQGVVAKTEFWVSDIGFYEGRNDQTGYTELLTFDTESGQPLEGVKVDFYTQNYNRTKREYENIFSHSLSSDANGKIVNTKFDDQRYIYELSKGEDKLNLNSSVFQRRINRSRNLRSTTHFFTDRAIYRPGQTLHFKALLTEKYSDEKQPKILVDKKVTITFLDANSQKISTSQLVSNEFGSISGTFTIPEGGLTGNFRLMSSVGGGRHSVSVEEYKRPKFKVEIEKPDVAYKLNEKVKVKGKADAFAGNAIDGATVNYRVVRRVNFPYWNPWFYRSYFPRSREEMEITSGQTQTQKDGTFSFDFMAIPDPTIDLKDEPVFDYEVIVDVIDISGETRSSTQTVKVGAVSLIVDTDIPKSIAKNQLDSIIIKTENLNGAFEAAQGTLSIQKLEVPQIYYKKRLWNKPDLNYLSKEKFQSLFPNFAYEDENLPQSWAPVGAPKTFSFNTANEKSIALDKNNWDVGTYKVTLTTKDRYGKKVEKNQILEVFDFSKNPPLSYELWATSLDKDNYQAGEEALLTVATAHPSQPVYIRIYDNEKTIFEDWISLNSTFRKKISIDEKHRGNLFYQILMGKDNRHYGEVRTISVPYTDKELDFEYLSFRDKLLPGQQEKWTLKITGSKKDKVMAEMLATLYDESLDQFKKHKFYLNLYNYNYNKLYFRAQGYTSNRSYYLQNEEIKYLDIKHSALPSLNYFGLGHHYYAMARENRALEQAIVASPKMKNRKSAPPHPQADMAAGNVVEEETSFSSEETGSSPDNSDTSETNDIPIRKNLKETVFFYPHLKTDKDGNILIDFKMNEALTRWKFLGMAHTKDLKVGLTEKSVVTQKDIMIVPNAPRFVREKDQLQFSAKVSNLSDENLSGEAQLELLDAISLKPVNQLFKLNSGKQNFNVKAGESTAINWSITVPVGAVNALTYRVTAKAGKHTDGEESTIPILSNRQLVTETLPLPVRGKETKVFDFEAMRKASKSNTLTHHKFTLEFTSNPAWYAVQALPYMMDGNNESVLSLFNRYYANAIATKVIDDHPEIKKVFERWKNTDALKSNLQKNEELKTALLQETPWVMDALSEEQQKQNIALLFDFNKMSSEKASAIARLVQRQNPDGGFSWFPRGRSSVYMTQEIVAGLGHLSKLGIAFTKEDAPVRNSLEQALTFLDDEMNKRFEKLQKLHKNSKAAMEKQVPSHLDVQYLYVRSFFNDIPLKVKGAEKARDYYLTQTEKHWTNYNIYTQAMIALALDRNGKSQTVDEMIVSFRERAMQNEELGMYWKQKSGYLWYQLPIETQVLMVEVFADIAQDDEAVEEIKVWLLKNKQTSHWNTSKATAQAVYAFLQYGQNWLKNDKMVDIYLANKKIETSLQQREAGTNYFKKPWSDSAVTQEMSEIKVVNPNEEIAWGAAYWQYFEDLDKITSFKDTPLQLTKTVYKEFNTDKGPEIREVTKEMALAPGDKLKLRITLKVDRPMDYVHLKDLRSSGVEPLEVISKYKFQDGLFYYQSTKDLATHFYFDHLTPGTYVLEYPVRIFNKGDFSNGITTIQSMYAPEFTSHSNGVRLLVKD